MVPRTRAGDCTIITRRLHRTQSTACWLLQSQRKHLLSAAIRLALRRITLDSYLPRRSNVIFNFLLTLALAYASARLRQHPEASRRSTWHGRGGGPHPSPARTPALQAPPSSSLSRAAAPTPFWKRSGRCGEGCLLDFCCLRMSPPPESLDADSDPSCLFRPCPRFFRQAAPVAAAASVVVSFLPKDFFKFVVVRTDSTALGAAAAPVRRALCDALAHMHCPTQQRSGWRPVPPIPARRSVFAAVMAVTEATYKAGSVPETLEASNQLKLPLWAVVAFCSARLVAR